MYEAADERDHSQAHNPGWGVRTGDKVYTNQTSDQAANGASEELESLRCFATDPARTGRLHPQFELAIIRPHSDAKKLRARAILPKMPFAL